MKRTLTGMATLAAVVCCAAVGSAQVLERVYTPESTPYIGMTTDFGYGVTPVYRAANYAPVAGVPTTTYYAPTTTSYYCAVRDHVVLRSGCGADDHVLRADLHELLRAGGNHRLLRPGCDHGLLCAGCDHRVLRPGGRGLRAGLLRPRLLLRTGSACARSTGPQRVPGNDLVSKDREFESRRQFDRNQTTSPRTRVPGLVSFRRVAGRELYFG